MVYLQTHIQNQEFFTYLGISSLSLNTQVIVARYDVLGNDIIWAKTLKGVENTGVTPIQSRSISKRNSDNEFIYSLSFESGSDTAFFLIIDPDTGDLQGTQYISDSISDVIDLLIYEEPFTKTTSVYMIVQNSGIDKLVVYDIDKSEFILYDVTISSLFGIIYELDKTGRLIMYGIDSSQLWTGKADARFLNSFDDIDRVETSIFNETDTWAHSYTDVTVPSMNPYDDILGQYNVSKSAVSFYQYKSQTVSSVVFNTIQYQNLQLIENFSYRLNFNSS